MIMVYGFTGLLMPHVRVLKKLLLFNVHLSCFVNFILCPTNKYMFKINKLVFRNCGRSIYC